MKTTRMLFVLTAVALASPAMAGETSGGSGKDAATTHSCPAHADRDGKLRCACAAPHEAVSPEPIFTDAG